MSHLTIVSEKGATFILSYVYVCPSICMRQAGRKLSELEGRLRILGFTTAIWPPVLRSNLQDVDEGVAR